MNSKTWLALLLLAALAFGILGWALLQPGENALRAEVYSGGELLLVLDLRQDQTHTVTTHRGTNEITVRDGKVAVTQADCPDGRCVQRGFCGGGAQIVCLPHRLVIRFVGEGEIDGISG